MDVRDAWAYNNGVRLHYLDGRWGQKHRPAPILYIPGGLAGAQSFDRDEMSAFAPRRCVSVSLRGRGRSDSPISGYSFADHVSDVEAIIDSAQLSSFNLLAYSMGVPVGLGYATMHPSRVCGAVLLDYPARYPSISIGWVKRAKKTAPDSISPHVIESIQSESRKVSLWNDLERLKCPVLIIHGGRDGALLREEAVHLYAKQLVNCTVVKFDDSDHQLWNPDPQKFFQTITDFLDELDPART